MYSSLKTLVQRNMFHALYPDESHAKLPHKVTANCFDCDVAGKSGQRIITIPDPVQPDQAGYMVARKWNRLRLS
jgi:hypothetical protein